MPTRTAHFPDAVIRFVPDSLQLRDEGLLDEPLQFSIVLGVRGGMAATPENLLTMVSRLPAGAVWQVIAIGRANLQLTAMGLALGGNARAGMEDTLYLRKGELVPGNRPLVERAVRPVQAGPTKKLRMREELLAHLTAIHEEELAHLGALLHGGH